MRELIQQLQIKKPSTYTLLVESSSQQKPDGRRGHVRKRKRFKLIFCDRRVLVTAPDSSGISTLTREHVGRTSATIGISGPIHKKTGRTRSRDPQYTFFFPPEPSENCARFFPRSLYPPRRIGVSEEHDQIEVGGREQQISFLSAALTDPCVG